MKKFKKKLQVLNDNAKNTEVNNMENKAESTNMKNSKWIIRVLVVLAFMVLAGYQYTIYNSLKQEITAAKQEITDAKNAARTIYVYSLEEAMLGINASEKKKKFEEEAVRLNEEVKIAEEKIKNLKEREVQEDFSDVYLNSLRLKRDNLVEEYHKMLEDLSEKVNKGLAEIAAEHSASTIFYKSAVGISTPYIVDVTPELVAKLKQ